MLRKFQPFFVLVLCALWSYLGFLLLLVIPNKQRLWKLEQACAFAVSSGERKEGREENDEKRENERWRKEERFGEGSKTYRDH